MLSGHLLPAKSTGIEERDCTYAPCHGVNNYASHCDALSLRVLRLYLHPQPVITDLLPEEPLPQVTEYGFYCGPSSPVSCSNHNAVGFVHVHHGDMFIMGWM